MANMLIMTALELSNPMLLIIEMKSDYFALNAFHLLAASNKADV
jgi:hypothetical protein|tara:strand:+ start:401 stop:532 length:132 start_codon:yes stop_codon:yes gene_type:complete